MNTKNPQHQTILGMLFISSLILFWVLLGFSLGILMALIFTIIVYRVISKKPHLEKYWKGLSAGMVVIALIGIFVPAVQQDSQMREEKQEIVSGKSDTYNYITEDSESYERSVELLAIDILGTSSVIERIGIDNNELNIEYTSGGNVSGSLTNYGILKDVEELIKSISPSTPENVSVINISVSMELVDTYGNTSIEKVSLVTMNRSTWEKINWDNFLTGDIPAVADYYWLHPALK